MMGHCPRPGGSLPFSSSSSILINVESVSRLYHINTRRRSVFDIRRDRREKAEKVKNPVERHG